MFGTLGASCLNCMKCSIARLIAALRIRKWNSRLVCVPPGVECGGLKRLAGGLTVGIREICALRVRELARRALSVAL